MEPAGKDTKLTPMARAEIETTLWRTVRAATMGSPPVRLLVTRKPNGLWSLEWETANFLVGINGRVPAVEVIFSVLGFVLARVINQTQDAYDPAALIELTRGVSAQGVTPYVIDKRAARSSEPHLPAEEPSNGGGKPASESDGQG